METPQATSSMDPPAEAAAEQTPSAPASPSPSTPTIALPAPSPSTNSASSPSSSLPQSHEQQHQSQSHSQLQSLQLKRGPAARTRSQTQLGQSSFPPPPTSSSSSSTSSVTSAQRSGLVIGVPAIRPHHPRPPLPVGHSFGSPSSFGQSFTSSGTASPSLSQPLGSFPRGSLSMTEQSPGPSPSLSQPFSGMPRSSAGMPEQQPNSGSQLRPPVPGVQTIGMIGSLSGASQMRASGVQHHQRLGQPNIRSTLPTDTNQSLNTQKLPTPGLSRPASISSSTSPLNALRSTQSLQQQWMSNQGKQTHVTSIPSSSYRPQMKQNILQQRPQSPYQLQQNSPPVTPSQLQISSSQQQQHQKQQPRQPEPQIMTMQLSELHKNQQSLPQQQPQSAKAHGPTTQRSNIPLASVTGTTIPVSADAAENCNSMLSKRSIRELLAQIDPSEKLESDVEDVLVEIADDFVESVTTAACSLAKHRQSNALEAKDILLHVERNWNMTLPGFGGDEIKFCKKPYTNDIHRERLSMIKKSIGIAIDGGNIKNNAAGQATNSKAQAGKASSAAASGSPKGI